MRAAVAAEARGEELPRQTTTEPDTHDGFCCVCYCYVYCGFVCFCFCVCFHGARFGVAAAPGETHERIAS